MEQNGFHVGGKRVVIVMNAGSEGSSLVHQSQDHSTSAIGFIRNTMIWMDRQRESGATVVDREPFNAFGWSCKRHKQRRFSFAEGNLFSIASSIDTELKY